MIISGLDEPRGPQLFAWPNPAPDHVSVLWRLLGETASALVVYDASGRMIRTLSVDGAGRTEWDLRDSSGHEVAPGTYFLRLTSGNGDQVTERVTIVR
jgi:Secretion system C-terminal sorting domain